MKIYSIYHLTLSVLSKLDENEYLAMLKDQALIEKAFKKESASSEADTSIASEVKKEEVSASVVEAKVEKSMDEENKVEMVEKSALETLQKALEVRRPILKKGVPMSLAKLSKCCWAKLSVG